MKSLKHRIASSLTGSHCAVFDLQADALTLSIGEAGCQDIELDVHSSDYWNGNTTVPWTISSVG